jgi:hypothetical protein
MVDVIIQTLDQVPSFSQSTGDLALLASFPESEKHLQKYRIYTKNIFVDTLDRNLRYPPTN